MRRRREEARDSSTESEGVEDIRAVSPQTLAGYQSALSHIINPAAPSWRDSGDLVHQKGGVQVDLGLSRGEVYTEQGLGSPQA